MEQQVQDSGFSSQTQATNSIEAPSISISDAINEATRKQHTTLNRLILRRLPLALPPTATDPSVYGQGIAAFARIYFAFEQEWAEVSTATGSPEENDKSHEAALRRWLVDLRPPGLERSDRLTADIRHVEQRANAIVYRCTRFQDRVLRRMRRSLHRKPHTLVAYAWVMYMALFSGGRIIRRALNSAGPTFWLGSNDSSLSDEPASEKGLDPLSRCPGFSFLCFDDGKDGIAIKAEFTSRLAEAEDLLSRAEREDIIASAVGLFEDCIILVGLLDEEAGALVVRSKVSRVVRPAAALLVIMTLVWIRRRHWRQ